MNRTHYDFHQSPSMAQSSIPNPSPGTIYSQNPLPGSVHSLFELDQSWKNQLNQNPNLIYQDFQNPNLIVQNSQNPNDFMFQRPLTPQNLYQNRYLMREFHQPQPQPLLQSPRYQLNNNGSLGLNPNFSDLSSLEDAMNRINLSSSQLLDQYSTQQSLNRMRSMYAGLGLLRSNLNPSPNVSYQNRTNRASTGTTRRNRWTGFSSVRENLSQYSSGGGYRADSVQRIPPILGLESRADSVIRYSLELVKGRIVNLSKTQEGSRFLQQKLDEKRPHQFEMIFSELKDHVCDLVVDQFASGVIQKLFGICNEQQMTQLLLILIKEEQKLLNICIHQHGTRAVQKMIDCMKVPDQSLADQRLAEQRFILVSALKYITVPLSKNNNGHHVIQQCFKCFSVDDTKCLLNEIANSCLEIAMDKSGCCVLQKSLTRAGGDLQNQLLADVAANALVLSEHPYGNYVVQFVLQMKIPHAEASLMERLMCNFVTLSMNKYGSNVVETCMKFCNNNNASKVIQELIHSRDFLDVLQDPFGNYVIQTALKTYKGEILYNLARVIEYYHQYLHSHLHGKKVLAELAETRRNRMDRM